MVTPDDLILEAVSKVRTGWRDPLGRFMRAAMDDHVPWPRWLVLVDEGTVVSAHSFDCKNDAVNFALHIIGPSGLRYAPFDMVWLLGGAILDAVTEEMAAVDWAEPLAWS